MKSTPTFEDKVVLAILGLVPSVVWAAVIYSFFLGSGKSPWSNSPSYLFVVVFVGSIISMILSLYFALRYVPADTPSHKRRFMILGVYAMTPIIGFALRTVIYI
jgi:hypothetical protein